MQQSTKGYLVLLAALGMMLTLLAPEIAALSTWHDAYQPIFASKVLAHFGAVLVAFTGGKMVPTTGGK